MVLRLLQSLAWLMARLPLRAALACGRVLGSLFGLVGRRQRARALEQLAWALPEKTAGERADIVRCMFRLLGQNTSELLRWLGGAGDLQARIAVCGAEHLDRAMAEGRGVLVLTAHLGNWDLMGVWAASRYPLTIISKEIRNPDLNRYWMEKRAAAGIHIVPAHGSYRACLTALRRGGVLGFILDQNMTRDDGIFVEFFGRPACTTPGLAVLSAHARAPVVPVFMRRRPDGGHDVVMLPALPPPPDRGPEAIAAAPQAYTRIIEEQVRARPEQWIWMHRRWRTQPQKG